MKIIVLNEQLDNNKKQLNEGIGYEISRTLSKFIGGTVGFGFGGLLTGSMAMTMPIMIVPAMFVGALTFGLIGVSIGSGLFKGELLRAADEIEDIVEDLQTMFKELKSVDGKKGEIDQKKLKKADKVVKEARGIVDELKNAIYQYERGNERGSIGKEFTLNDKTLSSSGLFRADAKKSDIDKAKKNIKTVEKYLKDSAKYLKKLK